MYLQETMMRQLMKAAYRAELLARRDQRVFACRPVAATDSIVARMISTLPPAPRGVRVAK